MSPRLPIEVCERIIDFVALRPDAFDGRKNTDFWKMDVHETLQACSLTCHAWRPRSQLHLMRDMSVRASITGYRSFHDLRDLLHKIPLLRENMEDVSVEGWHLDIPRFHLVPLELYVTLPAIENLVLRNGLVYMPAVFLPSMRRLKNLARLYLYYTTFLSMHDLRRMLDSLQY